MSERILELKNITKRYRKQLVLDNVSFTLERGHIYGFVGENGAGKSTTLRIITGISNADSGSVKLFGVSGKKELARTRGRTGCMIEHPVFDAALTAAENLTLYCLLYGIRDFSCIPRLLARTGLGDTAGKKVRDFSLGMKQRLGIAAALVSSPELLILDEPVNGLDPLGMIAVRKLLLSLQKDDGVTILLSSHILTELQELASDYIFISRGRILATVSAGQVLSGGMTLEQYYLSLFTGSETGRNVAEAFYA
ncbi:MAG: ATP-binding cassette domain-containing protein [Treponema sp.]|jgi:ABC-2 type transport system ATP-binding protein|nr:ATP-binding cassette domain-containing protein [Treponema sp.]